MQGSAGDLRAEVMIQRLPLQVTWREAAVQSGNSGGAKGGLFSCALVSTWPGESVSYLSTQLLNKQTKLYLESGRVFPLLCILKQVN